MLRLRSAYSEEDFNPPLQDLAQITASLEGPESQNMMHASIVPLAG
jgi:hypothetical protein